MRKLTKIIWVCCLINLVNWIYAIFIEQLNEDETEVFRVFEDIRANGEQYLVQVLNQGKVTVKTTNSEGLTLFMLAVDESYSQECLSELLQKGADINHQDQSGNTALHFAAMVKLIIPKLSRLNLFHVQVEDQEMIQFLVDNGANKSLKNQEGSLPADFTDDDDLKEILA